MIAMITAAISVISPFSIPIGTVPVSLSTFALMLGLYILGVRDMLISCLLYLALGAVGLPVFSNFGAGIPKLIGPTGGYLAGYLLLVCAAGLIMKLGKQRRAFDAIGFALGTALLYALGTLWLAVSMKMSFSDALLAGVIPFLPGDAVKIALAVALGPLISKRIAASRKETTDNGVKNG